MNKPKPTQTTNPIHFEDLDPKRFEDLVRELVYDFRDWSSIEATGKGGTDDGYDIRAFERAYETIIDDDGNEAVRPTVGNLWMIQCKREKSVTPSQIKAILADIDPKNPPYGYILAAATNFSKKSYDTFREELLRLGVSEFQLWGKATLETELYQPKNDRILFTFFGISNVLKRKSRSTELRRDVQNKNRIMRILGENVAHSWILARDSNDEEYPYQGRYSDFDDNPRWLSLETVELHPRGLIVLLKRCYAYVDEEAKIYDLIEPPINNRNPYDRTADWNSESPDERRRANLARTYWESLPQKNKAMFQLNGIIRFNEIVLIDEKGDPWFKVPHVFVEFRKGSPTNGQIGSLTRGEQEIELDDLTRASLIPEHLPDPEFGEIHKPGTVDLPSAFRDMYLNYRGGNSMKIFSTDHRFDGVKRNDVIVLESDKREQRFIQITHRYELKGEDVLQNHANQVWEISQHIGRDVSPSDLIDVLEFRDCYEHEFKN